MTMPDGSPNVNASGGDYAGRDMGKRQGTFYEGAFAGAALGGTAAAERPTLAGRLERVQEARERANRQGANQLADDLDSAALKLSQAMRAQTQGDTAWQREKLVQERQELEGLAQREPIARTGSAGWAVA